MAWLKVKRAAACTSLTRHPHQWLVLLPSGPDTVHHLASRVANADHHRNERRIMTETQPTHNHAA